MKLFKRATSMLSACVNEMLDKAEDPQAMVNQMIREMEQAYNEMQQHTIAVVATAKSTERKLVRTRNEEASVEKYVETAVRNNEDDTAKQAIRRRRTLTHMIAVLEIELKDASELSKRMKGELKVLETKVQEARIKRDSLLAKQAAAKTRQKLHSTSLDFNSSMSAAFGAADTIRSGCSGLDSLEGRIEKQMAEAEAREELMREQFGLAYELLAMDDDLDQELSALKSKMKAEATPAA